MAILSGLFTLLLFGSASFGEANTYEQCNCYNDYFDRILTIRSETLPSHCQADSPLTQAALSLGKLTDASLTGETREQYKKWKNEFPDDCILNSLNLAGGTNYQVCVPKGACGTREQNLVSDVFSGTGQSCSVIPDCAKNPQKDFSEIQRPCISKAYHKLIYSSYMRAKECLGDDPKEQFPLINHEGRFHLNSISASGASGPTQLTKPTIDQINQMKGNPYLGMSSLDLNSYTSRKECRAVAPYIADGLRAEPYCDRLSFPKNPMLNFLYSGIYRKYLHQVVDRKLKPVIARKIKSGDQDTVKRLLEYWYYNGGNREIGAAAEDYFSHRKGKISANQFYREFKKYLKKNFDPKSRRQEVSCYVDKMNRDLQLVRTQTRASGRKNAACAAKTNVFAKIKFGSDCL